MPEEVGVKEMEQGPEGRSVSYSGGSWEEMFLSPEFDETLQGLPSAIGGLIDTPSLVTSAWGVAWLWHHDRITQPRIPHVKKTVNSGGDGGGGTHGLELTRPCRPGVRLAFSSFCYLSAALSNSR